MSSRIQHNQYTLTFIKISFLNKVISSFAVAIFTVTYQCIYNHNSFIIINYKMKTLCISACKILQTYLLNQIKRIIAWVGNERGPLSARLQYCPSPCGLECVYSDFPSLLFDRDSVGRSKASLLYVCVCAASSYCHLQSHMGSVGTDKASHQYVSAYASSSGWHLLVCTGSGDRIRGSPSCG